MYRICIQAYNVIVYMCLFMAMMTLMIMIMSMMIIFIKIDDPFFTTKWHYAGGGAHGAELMMIRECWNIDSIELVIMYIY